MRSGYVAVMAVSLMFISGCSPEGPFKRLENEVNDLKVEIFRQRQEIEKLTNKAEAGERLASAERDRNNKFRADTMESLRKIEDNTQAIGNRASSSVGRQAPPSARPQTRPASTPNVSQDTDQEPDDRQLAMAERDFNAGNFEGAAEAADNLIKYFPDSDNIPEALFLKGRALYAIKSFSTAQESFQKLCNEYPRSERFLASRLSVGRCQQAQGNTLAAISTFEDISRRYPNSPEARSAREILQDIKANR